MQRRLTARFYAASVAEYCCRVLKDQRRELRYFASAVTTPGFLVTIGSIELYYVRTQPTNTTTRCQVYSHPERYMDFFDGETAARRKGMLYKWTREMREKGTWADQLFINAIARAHEVCSVSVLVAFAWCAELERARTPRPHSMGLLV